MVGFREIERILDRYGEIGKILKDSLDIGKILDGLITKWTSFGKFQRD